MSRARSRARSRGMPLGAAAKDAEVKERNSSNEAQRIGQQCNSHSEPCAPIASRLISLHVWRIGVRSNPNVATNKKAVRARRTATEKEEGTRDSIRRSE